ncbi:conserved Plasmodium protein, unknown function [Plasmodium ovale wallikeri]|uniref:Uncharacterized protein n=1 Tax=Plasmodium ovale wallikeri TaxID=864142 RepID=A0A1A8ZJB7_PLAOA|nr:conserved Plasmodium protein, unknown function [Plasmodium ovale wallikeri]SBT44144.1 conserved Plasmodium protein, unknown function [Plasmodium ovale wallikeri]
MAITSYIHPKDNKLIKIKNLDELENELDYKVYTNVYTYNTCYGVYFDFEKFLQSKNMKNIFCFETASSIDKIQKEFNRERNNLQELNDLINHFSFLFIELYSKNIKSNDVEIFPMGKKIRNYNHRFSKKRVIYLDLDNSFYIERYKNMIYCAIKKIKKLMNTYLEFCSEKKSSLFILLLGKYNKTLKRELFHVYKKHTKDHYLLIEIFNYHLEKYINDITFSDVFLNLQILKIFNFDELTNVVQFIYDQVQKYARHPDGHFNKYVPADLGAVVVDNVNYLHRSHVGVWSEHRENGHACGVHTSSEHISSEHISSEHISGEHISGEHISGEHISGEHISGEHISGEHISSEHINSTHTSSEHIGSAHTSSEQVGNAHVDSVHMDSAHVDSAHVDIAHVDSAHVDGVHTGSAHTSSGCARSAHKRALVHTQLKSLLRMLASLSTEHKICVLLTNNENNFLKKKDKYFNRIYSRYMYNNMVIKFINKKNFLECNYPSKRQNENNDDNCSSTEESFRELAQNYDEIYCQKRYNQRYIMTKKGGKTETCFFEINKFGIETLLR